MKSYPAIGIRPIVDSRRMGIRDALEGKVREMAEAAKKLIEENVFYADGTPIKVVIFPGSIKYIFFNELFGSFCHKAH